MNGERTMLHPYTGTSAHFDGSILTVTIWESVMPESGAPWFEITEGTARWKGQAKSPPTMDGNGRLTYTVEMQREND